MRILFIARYRDASMSRKLEYIAANRNVTLCHVIPAFWKDELLQVRYQAATATPLPYETKPVPLVGSPNDPHRAFYRTLTFGLRQFYPDIIHAEEEPDSLAALQIGIARKLFAPKAKLILNTWQNIDRPKTRSVKFVLGSTLKMADAVLCANQEAVMLLNQQGYSGKMAVIPAVGVDMRVFFPQKAEKAPPSDTQRFVIGYVGRLVKDKGLFELLAAFNQICRPSLWLQLIGDGNDRQVLQSVAQKLPCSTQIEFLPPASPADIADKMRKLDALVLPSKTTAVWKEQFGRVLTEAMACGVPVIGSDSGAIPEVIGETGLIFPEGDINELAHCLDKLSRSPLLVADLASKGFNRVRQHFSQETIAQKTLAFYKELMP